MTSPKFAQTPLLDVLSRGLPNDAAVRKALDEARPGDVNTPNSSQLTPLMAAIMNTSVQSVGMVVDAGAVVDAAHVEFTEKRYPHKNDVVELVRAHHSKQMLETEIDPGKKAAAGVRL